MFEQAINARTQLVGVMGHPVGHSLSPAMHNAVIAKLGLNWRYVAFDVAPEHLPHALDGLLALGIRGCNFTVPHKTAVLRWLENHSHGIVDADAKALGAVNTLVFGAGRTSVQGYNTDVEGYLGSLRVTGFDPDGKHAVVVGAGGAARGVIYGLLKAGASRVDVLNRTVERAEALVEDLMALPGMQQRLFAHPLSDDALVSLSQQADLLVNSTTVGMLPRVDASIWPTDVPVPGHLLVSDLVYNPLETNLLRAAKQAGAVTVDGLGMLARQGALALDCWTEAHLDIEAVTALMRTVCEQQLAL